MNIVALILALLGLSGVVAFLFLPSIWLLAAGVTLLALSALPGRFGSSRPMLLATAMGAVVVGLIVLRAGPLSSYSIMEWGYIFASLALWPAGVWLIRSSRRLSIYLSGVVVIPFAVTLFFAVAAFNTKIYDVRTFSQWVPMRDGVQLAVSVYLPRSFDRNKKLPTIILQTRYHRASDLRFPYSALRPAPGGPSPNTQFLARHGYAYVTVDVRGSGASLGTRETIYSDDEVRDGADVIDWIIQQPWSDGAVGLEGVSYNGTAAEFLLSRQHPAIKAVMPQFSFYDPYEEIIAPGGIFSSRFAETWSTMGHHLDRNTVGEFYGPAYNKVRAGVRPVDDDWTGAKLKQAIEQHQRNFVPLDTLRQVTFKDDVVDAFSPLAMSSFRYKNEIRATQVPMYSISGWLDGGYQYAAIKRFINTPNPGSRLVIGPWDHGGRQNISPCRVGSGELFDSREETLRFFDFHLKGIDNGFGDTPPIRYFTLCAESWQSADTWPPPATQTPYYFGQDGLLTPVAEAFAEGSDTYAVDLSATSGEQSRWVSYVNNKGVAIGYPDRLEQDKKLLTYESAALPAAVEVTGHPVMTLYMASSEPDGQLFVYLEDVAPDGSVAYVTEGSLRLLHHRLSEDPAPYERVTPYRSYAKADARLMVPGEVTEVVLSLWPTSYLFREGHRIRIAIAGADRDNFKPFEGPAPTYTFYRAEQYRSKIELPIR